MTQTQTATPATVRIGDIDPSPTNPRKTFDAGGLKELAASISTQGIIQPLVVRPRPDDKGRYEIVAGERRWRAARLAALDAVPVIVRELTDGQVLEVQVVENLQRAGLPPVEEAEGFAALRATGLDEREIAARVGLGKKPGYVAARLRLLTLPAAGLAALKKGRMLVSVAEIVARVPNEKLREEAVREVIRKTGDDNPMSFNEAARLLRSRFMLQLAQAPFATDDEILVPAAGSCLACPKRTGNQRQMFGEVDDAAVCTDTACFAVKKEAAWVRTVATAEAAGQHILTPEETRKLLSYSYGSDYVADRAPWVATDARCADDPKGRTWAAVLKKHAPPTAIVRFGSGKVGLLYAKAEAKKALRAALPSVFERREETQAENKAVSSEQRKKALQRRAITDAALAAVVTAGARKEPPVEVLRVMAHAFLGAVWSQVREAMATRRGQTLAELGAGLDALERASDVRAFLLELALQETAMRERSDEMPETLRSVCKAMGVDLRAVRKDASSTGKEVPAA